MSDPFTGEIRIVAFTFPPVQWAFCWGQLVQVQQNPVLFSILGTLYGGNGTTTFALPNLQGRAIGGASPSSALGETAGAATLLLDATNIPQHSHAVQEISTPSTQYLSLTPNKNTLPSPAANIKTATSTRIFSDGVTPATMSSSGFLSPKCIGPQSQQAAVAHDNMQPYLALNFTISLAGMFPSRN